MHFDFSHLEEKKYENILYWSHSAYLGIQMGGNSVVEKKLKCWPKMVKLNKLMALVRLV